MAKKIDYQSLLIQNNFESFLLNIIQTEKNLSKRNYQIQKAAEEILFEIRGNKNIVKKFWYNALYEKYQFKWRGYNHHHYFVWNDGQLNFLHKFPVVEHMKINEEDYILELLKDKYHWNTYYLWKDNIKYKHHEHPKDYFAPGNNEYAELVVKGINNSIINAGNFKKKMLKIESERS
jgi:hypothetical protein